MARGGFSIRAHARAGAGCLRGCNARGCLRSRVEDGSLGEGE